MEVKIDIQEFLDSLTLKYNKNKDMYVQLNGEYYTVAQTLEIAHSMIHVGFELLDIIKDNLREK